ncbi:hypothetical protein [Streptomyces fungicidicus]|uniref:hypothetical protein n=1 Tax=Streptomyces fungicidicus TaxID=68203 RepID=UPI0033FAB7AD
MAEKNAKEEQFKKQVDRLRETFSKMPLGALLVVQGVLMEVADQAMKEEKKG